MMTRKRGRKGLSSVTPKNSHSIRSDDYFSMQEEALITERHNDEWFTGTKLRSKLVPFVSAGSLSSPDLCSDQPTIAQVQSNRDVTPVSHSLADLDLSHVHDPAKVEGTPLSPTASVASSDEVVFVGKDPEARKGVTKHVAALGWESKSTSQHTQSKQLHANVKHQSVSVAFSSDEGVDDELYRDYIENADGLEDLDELNGLGGLQFVARPLALGEEFGNLSDIEFNTGTDTHAAKSLSTFQTNQTYSLSANEQSITEQIEGDKIVAQKLTGEVESEIDDSEGEDDGDDTESGGSDDDVFTLRVSKPARTTTDGLQPATLIASLLEADSDGEFDVADRDRPSLQRRKRKGAYAVPPALLDPDLRDIWEQSWAMDRQKKKERREEREKLRKQGLLGNSGKKPDLNEKYKEGMRSEDIKSEFMRFCSSTHQALSLPSMDKNTRKFVHEIAQSLGLKSKSTGNGDRRFVTVLKTKKFRGFDERAFLRIEQGQFFPRQNKGGPRSKGAWGAGDGGAKYREGDIVGGSAPEISADNRGRKMLGSMGWKDGQALGSSTNQGILQPIQHVVRNSRAGLG